MDQYTSPFMLHRFLHGTFSSLKIRNYRLYFIGQSISVSGTFMQTVAQAWLVLTLTGSGTELGIVTALQYLPMLLLAPLGGILVDRVPKRRLILVTQIISAVQAFVFWVLVVSGMAQLWMIYLLATVLGTANAVDNPARNSFVIEMVGRDDVPNAITLNSIQFNISRIIGPAIAGMLILTVGLSMCFLLNVFSFIAVIVCLLLMRPQELHFFPSVHVGEHPLREGLHHVWTTPTLRNTVIMLAIIGTLTYEFPVSLPLFAEYTLHGGPDGFSLLMSTMGIGAVIGGLAVARRRTIVATQMVLIALLFGCSILLVSIMPNLLTAALLMIVVGVLSVAFTSLGNAVLQLESAPAMRGRVLSLWTMTMLGSTAIGGPIIGWIGEIVGGRAALAVGGGAAIIAALLGWMTIGGVRFWETAKISPEEIARLP